MMTFSWRVASGTLTGPHHRKHGEQNQDAYGVLRGEDFVVMAAADGAGSLPLSHIGSQLAVDVLLATVRDAEGEMSLKDQLELGMENAREALRSHPDRNEIGCTLAAVLISPDGYAVAVAGDAFAVLRLGSELKLYATPPAGEYANITQLLTSDTCDLLLDSGEEIPTGAAVSTDGLEYSSLKDGKPFSGFWSPVFGWTETVDHFELTSMLNHMETQGRIDDDTTLVVGVPS